MEYKLVLKIVLFDGREVIKSYDIPPDPKMVQAAINQLISTFMQAGFIEPLENGLRSTRVNTIDVEVPSIVITQPGEVPPAGKISLT